MAGLGKGPSNSLPKPQPLVITLGRAEAALLQMRWTLASLA